MKKFCFIIVVLWAIFLGSVSFSLAQQKVVIDINDPIKVERQKTISILLDIETLNYHAKVSREKSSPFDFYDRKDLLVQFYDPRHPETQKPAYSPAFKVFVSPRGIVYNEGYTERITRLFIEVPVDFRIPMSFRFSIYQQGADAVYYTDKELIADFSVIEGIIDSVGGVVISREMGDKDLKRGGEVRESITSILLIPVGDNGVLEKLAFRITDQKTLQQFRVYFFENDGSAWPLNTTPQVNTLKKRGYSFRETFIYFAVWGAEGSEFFKRASALDFGEVKIDVEDHGGEYYFQLKLHKYVELVDYYRFGY